MQLLSQLRSSILILHGLLAHFAALKSALQASSGEIVDPMGPSQLMDLLSVGLTQPDNPACPCPLAMEEPERG